MVEGEEKGRSFLRPLVGGDFSWEMQRYHEPGGQDLGLALVYSRGQRGGRWGFGHGEDSLLLQDSVCTAAPYVSK